MLPNFTRSAASDPIGAVHEGNGAERSPDVSWVLRERWEVLTADERKKFPPPAPDFVIELRSESDRLSHLQAKMQEYADNGVRLGWLIDPITRRVEIYRPGRPVETLDAPASLSGEPELPGFVLDLSRVCGVTRRQGGRRPRSPTLSWRTRDARDASALAINLSQESRKASVRHSGIRISRTSRTNVFGADLSGSRPTRPLRPCTPVRGRQEDAKKDANQP
jgi:hypothetical protein